MNKKKKFLLSALFSLVLTMSSAAAFSMSACKPGYESRGEDGTYYCVIGEKEYKATLNENVFSIETENGLVEGSYKYDGTAFEMTSKGNEVSATLNGDCIVITVNGVEYMFYKQLFTVTYEMDGGSAVAAEAVPAGKAPTVPAAPGKEGYVFIGWYQDAGFKKKFDFTAPITANTTVYARFILDSLDTEFTVKLIDGENVVGEVETLNGVLYNLPTPEKEGANFLGWWVGVGAADKLSYKYDEHVIGQNTALYAVWDTDETISLNVTGTTVSWKTNKVGAVVAEVFYPDGTSAYTYRGTDNSFSFDFAANVAGQYQVDVKINGVTYTAYYNNKVLDASCHFSVEDYIFLFNKVANAEKYLLTVECGDSIHSHVDIELDGDTNSFDFSTCSMHKDGIKFTVKSVADGYATTVSDTYVFTQKLETVKNIKRDVETEKLTWDAVPNAESYTVLVTDGTRVYSVTTDQREIDVKGVTGNVIVNITPNARLFNSEMTFYSYTSTRLLAPANISLSGNEVTWDAVQNATGYIVTIDGKTYDATTNKFDISGAASSLEMGKSYDVFVQAKAANEADSSMKSDAFKLTYAVMSDDLVYEANTLKWSAVFGASKYGYRVNGGDEVVVDKNQAAVTLTKAGDNLLEVRLYDVNGDADDTWVSINVFAYTVNFDMDGGNKIDPYFFANGDKINLDALEPVNTGYTFKGWTDDEGKMVGAELAIAGDVSIKANWEANVYKVTLSTDGYVQDVVIDGDVVHDITFASQNYSLPKATTTDTSRVFMGWYTQKNGQGVQCTDENGAATGIWNFARDLELYAKWGEVFSFNEINNGEAWSISAGPQIGLVSEVTIPGIYQGKPVTTVESLAFKSCSSLKVVNVPDNIENIELGMDGGNQTGSAFYLCSKLEAINVFPVEGNHDVKYSSYDGVLYSVTYDIDNNVAEKTLLYCPVGKKGECTVEEGTTMIDICAFRGSYVTKIEIPHTVKTVGKRAFYSAYDVVEINFLATPTDVEEVPLTLGEQVFESCSDLTSITLPARLGEIDVSIIKSCSKLENVNIVGNGAYSSINGVLVKTEGGITSLVYVPRAKSGEFRIPVGVTRIAEGAFGSSSSDRVKLTSVIIPEWVTVIEEKAFANCSTITNLKFEGTASSKNLTIKRQAFLSCTGLTKVELPENLTVLEQGAFATCSKLIEVSVTTAVTDLRTEEDIKFEAGAFAQIMSSGAIGTYYLTTLHIGPSVPTLEIAGVFGNAKLENITVDPENPNYASQDGVLFNKEMTQLLFFPSERGGHYVVPDTVTTIGGAIFEGNKALFSITIGSGVTTIGEAAFKNCTALTKVTFLEGGSDPLEIKNSAFYGCNTLTHIELPERTQVIEDNVFYLCSKLEEIFIPKNVVKFGGYETGKVTLLDGTQVEKDILASFNVFYGCNVLKDINVDAENEYFMSIDGILYSKQYVKFSVNYANEADTFYEVGSFSVDPTSVFYDESDGTAKTLVCAPRANVGNNGTTTVPGTVMMIANNAFYYNGYSAGGIQVLNFEETNNALDELLIGRNAFYYMSECAKLVLPEGYKTAQARTFYSSKFEHITLPKSLTTIEPLAFYYCSSLEEVVFVEGGTQPLVIESGVNTSGTTVYYRGAFSGSSKLKKVVLPARTSQIGSFAFTGCYALESLTIPANVEFIGDRLFGAYSGSSTSTVSALATLTFEKEGYLPVDTTELEAPAAGVTYYTLVDGNYVEATGLAAWAENTVYYERKVSALTTIGEYAFQYTSLVDVVLPDTVTTVGKYAFYYCKSLKSLTFGSGLATLGDNVAYYATELETVIFDENCPLESIPTYAFYNCGKLKSVVLPNNVTKIETYAFKSTGLESVTLNEGLQLIKDQAFNSTKLTSVTIPYTVTDIGTSAFASITSLTQVSFTTNADGLVELKNIGSKAFSATGVVEFIFPESTSKFVFGGAGDVLLNCKSLEKIHLSTSVTGVEGLFIGCKQIKEVTVAEGHENLAVDSNMKMITSADGRSLLLLYTDYVGELTITDGVETIGANVFENQAGITSVFIPQSVKEIGNSAFSGCTGMTQLTFAENSFLAKIGEKAFALTSLETLEIPASVTSIGNYAFAGNVSTSLSATTAGNNTLKEIKFLTTGNIATLGKGVFQYNRALETVTLPAGLKTIGDYMFGSCSALKTIELPKELTKIGQYAFTYCTALESIHDVEIKPATETEEAQTAKGVDFKQLPKLTSIGNYAFRYCKALEAVQLSSKITTYGTYIFADGGVQYVFFEDGQKTGGGNYMFQNNPTLKEVTLYSSITKYGTNLFKNTGVEKINFLQSGSTPFSTFNGGTSMFADCKSLKSVELPVITTWASSMFQNCTALESVTLPEGVTNLNATSLFSGCTALKEVTIPSTVGTIAGSVFANCTSLEKVTFATDDSGATAVKLDGTKIFSTCTSLKSVVIPATVTITSKATNLFEKCTALESVIFEENANGNGLTLLPNYAFDGCKSLKTVKLPTTVTELGTYVFRDCTELNDLTFESTLAEDGVTKVWNLEKIGNYAFANTKSLTTLEMPSSVKTFGTYMFNKSGITEIVIPAGVETIPTYAFESAVNLKSVTFAEGSVLEGIGNYAFKNTTALPAITLPASLTSIGTYAFQYSTISSVNIPAGVTSISKYAFDSCEKLVTVTFDKDENGATLLTSFDTYTFGHTTSLKSIDLPETMTFLGTHAFYGSGLESIKIPKSVEYIGNKAGSCDAATNASTFANCVNLKTITFHENFKGIGQHAFSGCTSLETIVIPDSVTILGNYAFQDCTALKNITIGAGVKEIGKWTFSKTGIESIVIPATVKKIGYAAIYECPELTTITLNEGLEVIDEWAFSYNPKLTSITIPNSVTSIGNYALAYLDIETLTLPTSLETIGNHAFDGLLIKTITIPEGVTSIGDGAFYNCEYLETVNFAGNKVETIGASAFEYCPVLKDVSIPTAVTKIGDKAFKDTAISYVSIPASVTSIGNMVFYNCANLTEISVASANTAYKAVNKMLVDSTNSIIACPMTITGEVTVEEGLNIGAYAFAGCTGITKVILPYTAIDIGTYAFYNCSALTEIVIPKELENIGAYAFVGCEALTSVDLSNVVTLGEAFAADSGITEVVVGGKLTTVEEGTFDGMIGVTFAEGLTELPLKAFYNNTTLKKIVLPQTLVTIGNQAFEGCTGLTELVIPDSVKEIGYAAFKNATNLEKVVLGVGVETIGNNAFEGTEKLVDFDLNKTIVSLGNSAFKNSGIQTITIPASLESVGASTSTGSFSYSALKKVVFEEGAQALPYMFYQAMELEEVQFASTMTEIGQYAFQYAVALRKVDLSATQVETIGKYAFAHDYSLREVIFPDTLKVIETYAFGYYNKLTTITLPQSLTTVGTCAFIHNYSLKEWVNLSDIQFSLGVSGGTYLGTYGVSLLTEPATPETTKLVTVGDFEFIKNLEGTYLCIGYNGTAKDVVLPDTVNGEEYMINEYAFYGNRYIDSVKLGSGCVGIGKYAFAGASTTYINELKSITFNEGLEIIDTYAFSYADCLDEIVLPSTVTSVGKYAFSNARHLRKVDMSKTQVVELLGYTFNYCYSLQEVLLPEKLEVLGDKEFYYNYSLTTITIPETVTTIGSSSSSGVFAYCYQLLEVINKSNVDLMAKTNTAGGISTYAISQVDDPSKSIYRQQGDFKFYYNEEEETWTLAAYTGNDVNVILPDYYMDGDQKCTYVVDTYAFYYDYMIETLYIGEGCVAINSYAFRYASKLTKVYVGNGVTDIGQYAFANCTELSEVYLGKNVTNVGSNAFNTCNKLGTIYCAGSESDITWGSSAKPAATKVVYDVTYTPDGEGTNK